jgi:DNA repair exonuclease SbcCD ATPase subunit
VNPVIETTSAERSANETPLTAIRPPDTARRVANRLIDKRDELTKRSRKCAADLQRVNQYLGVAENVTAALEQLSDQLFQQLLGLVQEKLTVALQEILDSPIALRADADFKRGAATVDFWIDRQGNREHVLLGQGGSVANVLSVGLRMFALATLDESEHRRFLVLDEQDCWLRPDLVPRLVKIVHEASAALGFQVLMISHHDVALFEQYAERIYEFRPAGDGEVEIRERCAAAIEPDRE